MLTKRSKIILLRDRDTKYYTSLTHSFNRAFQKNDYDCDIMSFKVNRSIYKASTYFPGLKNIYLALGQIKILKGIEKSNSDMIFVIKGYYLKPATISKIKRNHKIVICFNPDDPFDSEFGTSNHSIRSSISYYDAYFIWHRKLVQPIRDAGCKNVFYLPFAADTDIIKPRNLNRNNVSKEDCYAVSFIGNSDRERIASMNRLSFLLRDWSEKKAVFGTGWKNIKGFECVSQVVGENYLDTMHRTKINLNILRNQNRNSNNMRTFEIPAAGGFMLHEYSEEAADFFKEGIEAEFYRDMEECADKIKYYFNHDDIRNKIAQAGYMKVFSAGYTYISLVKTIEKKINDVIQQ